MFIICKNMLPWIKNVKMREILRNVKSTVPLKASIYHEKSAFHVSKEPKSWAIPGKSLIVEYPLKNA